MILLFACGNTASDSSRTDASDTASLLLSQASPEQVDLAAAKTVIHEYYDAIAAHDYQRAYLLWGDSGRSSIKTFEKFRAGFGNTAAVDVRIGDSGRIEGAAGSRFVQMPVQIEAKDRSGAVQRFAGRYLLAQWTEDPARAVGRQVSNPWPQRIEITDMRGDRDEAWLVRANIVYVTSADTAQVVDRAPVTLQFVRAADGIWGISDVDHLTGRPPLH